MGRRSNGGPQHLPRAAVNADKFADTGQGARRGSRPAARCWRRGRAIAPIDRSLSVKLDSDAPDGFVVHSFAGDDPLVCRDHVREKAGLEPFKPTAAAVSAHQTMRSSAHSWQRRRGNAVMAASATSLPSMITPTLLACSFIRFCGLNRKVFASADRMENGGWIWELDERHVPYHWPELLKYPDGTVFICEGEKDADRIASPRTLRDMCCRRQVDRRMRHGARWTQCYHP